MRHLSDVQADSRSQLVLDQVKAVAFLATPHQGAELATWLDRLGLVLRATPVAQDLTANNAMLRDLNRWYREHAIALNIQTLC